MSARPRAPAPRPGGPAVSEDNLHFGTDPDDPTGIYDCATCPGTGVVNGMPCPACHERQQLRNAWWNSSTGPERLRQALRLDL